MPASREDKNECNEQSLSKKITLAEVAESKSTVLASILDREIKKEITIRRCDLETVEYRIYQTRQNLAKIRQGIVSEYYRQNYKGILQLPPHPAVKDTFHGKCLSSGSNLNIKNEGHIQTDVEPHKSEFDTSNKVYDKQNGCDTNEKIENHQISKMPRYIPPKYRDKDIVRSSEPRGNVKKKKFRITIGNVSKWIFDEANQSKMATHKWTVYVKCHDQEVEITSIISKVTFFLHNSYKPNDVVTVDYAPFKLTRRGWGEFPLRVQLHFVNSLDKPVDVIHLLKLDTTHSGLETFGCETIVDVWAHCNEYCTENNNGSSMISSDIIEPFPIIGQQQLQQPVSVLGDKSATDLSDSYLSASSLSMISMPTEIPNEIITEILGDNHDECGDISIKEEIVDTDYSVATASLPIESADDENSWNMTNGDRNISIKQEVVNNDFNIASTSIITSESEDKTWFVDMEKSFNCKNEMVQGNLHENIVHTLENSAMAEIDLKQNEEIIKQRTASISSDYSFTEHLTSDSVASSIEVETTEQYYNQSQDILSENNSSITCDDVNSNNDLDSSTQITYNPIECLNFVQDEIVIKSEEDDDQLVTVASRQSINENSLTCKDYLENFMNSEIKSETSQQSFEQLAKKQKHMMKESENTIEVVDTVEVDESQSYQQMENNIPFIQEITINNEIIKFNDNKPCDYNLLNNNGCGKLIVNNITNPLDKLNSNKLTNIQNIKNNTVCLNKRISFSSNNKPNLYNLTNTENLITTTTNKTSNNNNKILVKDLNSLGSVIISPMKTNLNQIKLSNVNINTNNKCKNESIILLKNNNEIKNLAKGKTVINKNNLTSFNKYNSKQQLILASAHSTNLNSVNQKSIKTHANGPLFMKKKLFVEMPNGQLKEIRSGTSFTDCKLTPSSKPIIIESQPMFGKRKFYHTVSSSPQEVSVLKFTEPAEKKVFVQPSYRFVPSVRADSNGEPYLSGRGLGPLKVVQKGKPILLKTPSHLQQSSILRSATAGSANNSQIIKITNSTPLILDNRNVMLQRKVLPGESLLKKGISSQKSETSSRPEVSIISGILSDRELVKRCPREHVEFAVNWLIKQFPLVNGKAGIEYYKTKHPYCAVDRVTFLKWPLAKQRAAEWMRAKKIKRLVGRVCPHLKPWSTLQIIDWARLRGFTPLGLSLRCNNLSIVNKDTSFSFTVADLSSILSNNEHVDEKDVDIDVDYEIETEKIIKTQSTREDRLYFPLEKKYQDIGDYLFKSCDNIGIHFYEEELTPGVVYPAVERVLVSLFHSVADDLFRRSLSASCMRTGAMPATEILLDDVKMALLSRVEFDIFTNEGLGTCINEHKNDIK